MRDALQAVYEAGSPTVGDIQEYPQCCNVDTTQYDSRFNNDVSQLTWT